MDQVVDDVWSLDATSPVVLVSLVGAALPSSWGFAPWEKPKVKTTRTITTVTRKWAMVMLAPRCRRLDVGRSFPMQKKLACPRGSFYVSRVRPVQQCAPASRVADDLCQSTTLICR